MVPPVSETQPIDVIVIGAGAAGMMCAITAGQRRRTVLVLERANKVGKKILMSGGGRCNFTNLEISADNYLSANPHFCKSALSRYTQWDFIELVRRHGIPYHEKADGQLFCDESSKDILAMLLKECETAGVRIITRCEIESVEANGGFELVTSRGRFHAAKLVVASGGLSIPTLGGSGFGYKLAEQFGHHLLPRRAGLAPFVLTGEFDKQLATLAGLSLTARVATGNRSFAGDILFTHRGLSGPAMLQLSSYWQTSQPVSINLFPETNALGLLRAAKKQNPRAMLHTTLGQWLPKRLVTMLAELWWPEYEATPLAEITDSALSAIAGKLQHWSLTPAGTEGYRTAEVTLGGVDTRELSSKTMESQLQPGLFFIGEVVDVSGHLGGYNFQWAWSSGHAAGEAV